MIIFTRADESRRGMTHTDAEASGAWRHDHDHIMQNIQASSNVESQGVASITTVKIRKRRLIRDTNMILKMNFFAYELIGLIGALPVNMCCDDWFSLSENFEDNKSATR